MRFTLQNVSRINSDSSRLLFCVRASRVTIARVSLHSCYIARLIRTSVCRADTGWMTKSRTVDPESRFSLSTIHARAARILGAHAPISLAFPRYTKTISRCPSSYCHPFARIHPRYLGMFCETLKKKKKKITRCVSSYKLYQYITWIEAWKNYCIYMVIIWL